MGRSIEGHWGGAVQATILAEFRGSLKSCRATGKSARDGSPHRCGRTGEYVRAVPLAAMAKQSGMGLIPERTFLFPSMRRPSSPHSTIRPGRTATPKLLAAFHPDAAGSVRSSTCPRANCLG